MEACFSNSRFSKQYILHLRFVFGFFSWSLEKIFLFPIEWHHLAWERSINDQKIRILFNSKIVYSKLKKKKLPKKTFSFFHEIQMCEESSAYLICIEIFPLYLQYSLAIFSNVARSKGSTGRQLLALFFKAKHSKQKYFVENIYCLSGLVSSKEHLWAMFWNCDLAKRAVVSLLQDCKIF